jgi:hypothetical protein
MTLRQHWIAAFIGHVLRQGRGTDPDWCTTRQTSCISGCASWIRSLPLILRSVPLAHRVCRRPSPLVARGSLTIRRVFTDEPSSRFSARSIPMPRRRLGLSAANAVCSSAHPPSMSTTGRRVRPARAPHTSGRLASLSPVSELQRPVLQAGWPSPPVRGSQRHAIVHFWPETARGQRWPAQANASQISNITATTTARVRTVQRKSNLQ